jgi:hypothetical protein
VDAVVLRHSDYGEADRLLTLYTREQGKLRAIAKGVRKIQSRKAGHLEPFTRVALMLARGHDLWIVTQAETLNSFQPLREDLGRMSQAAHSNSSGRKPSRSSRRISYQRTGMKGDSTVESRCRVVVRRSYNCQF